ncbi:MAG: alpha-2-macroglobulin family protein [Bradymonadia bacterium]
MTFNLPGRPRWRPAFLLPLGLTALAIGCGDADNTNRGGENPPVEQPEQHTVAGLRIDEGEIKARIDGDALKVALKLHRTSDGIAEGTAKIVLSELVTPEAEGDTDLEQTVAEGEAPFTIDADSGTVEISIPWSGAPSAEAELASYVLQYRVDWSAGSPLWGKRSLFAAWKLTEAQLLATDRLLADAPAFVRLMTRDPRSGEPLGDLPVTVRYVPKGPDGEVLVDSDTILFEGRTDALGELAAQLVAPAALAGEGEMVVALETAEGPREIRSPIVVERASKVLVTTDKPLYQPGQVMHLRALSLVRPNLTPDAGAEVVFEIYDGKDNKVERLALDTDDYGVASAQFKLAREVNMGRYRIVATVGETVTEKTVTVERYALPKFDLDIELDKDVYFAGDEMVGTVHARYFFGKPVAGANVRLAGSTFDVQENVFAEIAGTTNEEGLYRFNMLVPDYLVGLPLEQGGGALQLALEVTDTAGQARSVARTIRVARGPLEITVVPEGGDHVPGVSQKLLLRSVDAAGRPVAAVHQIEVNGAPAVEAETDAQGLGDVEVMTADAQLSLRVVSTSADGEVTSTFDFAAGDPAPAGHLLVRPARSLYAVGDTLSGEIIVSGASDRVYIDVVRQGQTVLTDVVRPDADGRAPFELTLTPDHTGPLTIGAYYLAQGSSIRRDTAQVYVDAADGLKVSINADRAEYAPGEEATLTIRVADAEGEGQAAAVGLVGVDEAVYSLMEFRPGLLDTYFRIEGELAKPRYQVGVPGLSTLISAEAGEGEDAEAVEATRQAHARMLFAAGGEVNTHPVAINTYAEARAGVPNVVRPIVQARLQVYAAPLIEAINASVDPWNFDVQAWVSARGEFLYDPWGKPMSLSVRDNWNLALSASGPDEIAGTEDDVEVTLNIYAMAVPGGDARFDDEGDFDQAAEGAPPPQAGGGAVADPEAEPDADGNGGGGVRVRRNFPETLFVEPALITDGNGEATLTLPLADSITTWRVSALANSATGLLGSGEGGVRVFQDFFVDIDFPATLTRGDAFSAPVAVYNYLDRPQQVRLQVQAGDWFSLEGPEEIVLDLEAGEVAGVRLPLQVERVGVHELTVIARGEALSDGVARTILVEPDGQKVESVASGALDGTVTQTISIPNDAIEGSERLLVKLYPGVFASVVEGLDGILQMPSGCFEQTSSSTWPNVLVARYMDETQSGSPELMLRANEYINTGYQRLLTFEVDGGGFEWFGNPPSHTVLTAYGLLEFTDMAQVRPVDADMIERTRAWLLSQQFEDGHWEAARGLDETGQLSDPVAVTAYIAFALAEAGENGPAMAKAQQFLQANEAGLGTYSLALAANFMVAFNRDDAFTGRLLGRLEETVEDAVDDIPGQHWQTDEQTTTYGQGQPAFIETTALATHALLAANQKPALTQAALAWLVAQKSPSGAWGSTAGTVWTIKCLLKSLQGGRDDSADATVRVLVDGMERASFTLTPENSDVMRQADLSTFVEAGQQHEVSVVIDGEGNLQYGVVSGWHAPWPAVMPGEGPLSIEVSYDRTELAVDDTVTATVRITNNDVAFSDMVMVDLGLPPGFDLITSDLDDLVTNRVFSKYERTERQLLLYFTEVRPDAPVEFSYRLVARDPIRAEAPRSRIYSYYNPDVGSEALPIEIEVQ